jgi:hypothetical protein
MNRIKSWRIKKKKEVMTKCSYYSGDLEAALTEIRERIAKKGAAKITVSLSPNFKIFCGTFAIF